MKDKQIKDAILMANEMVDYWKKSKTKGFILKLDVKNAFDTISWNFIDFMLRKKNYPT